MPFPRKLLNRFRFYVGVLSSILLVAPSLAFGLGDQPIHFAGDKQVWDRKANLVDLKGNAAVVQTTETLTADHIHVDLNSRILDAYGNAVYIAKDSLIFGDHMHFNIDTHTGTVYNGRVASEKFSLRGVQIRKLAQGRLQTHEASYTTCKDCAAAWTLDAKDVDFEVEGYAYFSGVVTKIKDAPAFWIPYMVLPMKTKRQSGFLFPSFSFGGTNGVTFVMPYFWAIDRSVDMTLGLGDYSTRGPRVEWESRYLLLGRSWGRDTFFYLSDKSYGPTSTRWATDMTHVQELPFQIDARLKLSEVSDTFYPFYFPDVPSASGEEFMRSSLFFSRGSPDVSAYVGIQRYRNLLNTTPGDPSVQQIQFDPRTVQVLPTAAVTTHDRVLWNPPWKGPIMGGLTFGYTNFSRSAGPFDYDGSRVPFGTAPPLGLAFMPGVDPIRQASRFSYTPTLYTTLRPIDEISVVPSLQYRGYHYDFNGLVPNLDRGYLLFQTDISTQIERVFEYPDDKKYPRIKHLIRPTLTYSLIPVISPSISQDYTHPFLQQIQNAQSNGITGYNFDDYDIVPYTFNQSGANYFVPLGHSLQYGFVTQWVRRSGPVDTAATSYTNIVELTAGQAINFLELSKPGSLDLFTRFYSSLNLNFEKLQSSTTYYYYPDPGPQATSGHVLSTSATYVFERSLHQRILNFERSVSLSYSFNQLNGYTSNLTGSTNFSISDYMMPFGAINFGFVQPPQLYSASAGIKLQSPSQCWLITTSASFSPTAGISYSFDWSLNLAGNGFGAITDFANMIVSH